MNEALRKPAASAGVGGFMLIIGERSAILFPEGIGFHVRLSYYKMLI